MAAENVMFFQIHYTSSLRGRGCPGDRRRHRATQKERERIGNAEGRKAFRWGERDGGDTVAHAGHGGEDAGRTVTPGAGDSQACAPRRS